MNDQIFIEPLLLKRIENMKKNMAEIANMKGINIRETITCSQEIDCLVNIYMKNFGHKEK
jgi:hypothetical protein